LVRRPASGKPVLTGSADARILHSTMKRTLPAIPPFSFAAVAGLHGLAQLAPFRARADEPLTCVQRLDPARVVELALRAAATHELCRIIRATGRATQGNRPRL
jgi:hypothetical protein